MGPAAIVVRHPQSGAPDLVARYASCVVINAGDGTHEHPSQALLDTFTLWKQWGGFEGKRVAIVGDVLHSRVARSNLYALQALGAKVVLVGTALADARGRVRAWARRRPTTSTPSCPGSTR